MFENRIVYDYNIILRLYNYYFIVMFSILINNREIDNLS
jgi:hypothetical protein